MKYTISRKYLIVSGALVLLAAPPSVYLSLRNNQGNPPPHKIVAPSNATQDSIKQPIEQSVETPVQSTQPVVTQNIDPVPAPTNPYPEGSNIWHSWNRRTSLGMQTPEGNLSDQTYWQKNAALITDSVSQYAIILDGRHTVNGIVEAVNTDGSLSISCTNCGQWNTYTEKQVPADQVSRFKFIQ